MTISDQSGETVKTLSFKGEPIELCVAACKDDRKGSAGGGSFKREVRTTISPTNMTTLFYPKLISSSNSKPRDRLQASVCMHEIVHVSGRQLPQALPGMLQHTRLSVHSSPLQP